MKGKSRTSAEKKFHDQMASLGCVACDFHDIFTPYVSIHHIEGRTRPGSHFNVLPLCASHHQDMGNGAISVHPYKARFEAMYGNQMDLLRACIQELKNRGFDVPEDAEFYSQ